MYEYSKYKKNYNHNYLFLLYRKEDMKIDLQSYKPKKRKR